MLQLEANYESLWARHLLLHDTIVTVFGHKNENTAFDVAKTSAVANSEQVTQSDGSQHTLQHRPGTFVTSYHLLSLLYFLSNNNETLEKRSFFFKNWTRARRLQQALLIK